MSGEAMRRALKDAVERGLVDSGIARWGLRRRCGQRLVLAYHNIVPDGTPAGGDASLHLPRRRFVEQLDAVEEWCDVVPLTSVLGPSHDTARPQVIITFDDAYFGAVTLGVGELARRSLPATIFVVPGCLGRLGFWWDRYVPAQHGLTPASFRELALEQLRGDDAAIEAWARDARVAPAAVDPAHRVADQTELQNAVGAHPGLTLASHSWSHANLSRLTGDALSNELSAPLAWLADHAERSLRWLSYPYGRWSPPVAQAAAAAGYDGALAISGGWIDGAVGGGRGGAIGDRYAVPRYNVPAGLSLRGFRLRLAGLVGP